MHDQEGEDEREGEGGGVERAGIGVGMGKPGIIPPFSSQDEDQETHDMWRDVIACLLEDLAEDGDLLHCVAICEVVRY